MNQIQAIRERHGVTQARLAKELGWLASRLSNYERDQRSVHIVDAHRITAALNRLGANCDISDVFPAPAEGSAA